MVVYDEKDCVNKKMQVLTPELWQFGYLIFGPEGIVLLMIQIGSQHFTRWFTQAIFHLRSQSAIYQ